MANIAHSVLTGVEIHEPKGADAATLGTVYVADGAGSGSWSSIATSSLTGMIADHIGPAVPSGWLELDGSDINTTTYSTLYNVMSIQLSGSRINGSPVVTGISSTANMRAGYYVFASGIASGVTILSVDSANQITLSANASITVNATMAISPWLMNTGTIRLPNVTSVGRFRRSRTSSTAEGQVQADQNQAHTHTLTGTAASGGAHTHTATVTDPGHLHNLTNPQGMYGLFTTVPSSLGFGAGIYSQRPMDTANSGIQADSTTTGITVSNSVAPGHTHDVTGTTASSGSTEARPLGIVFITCVKT